MNQNVNEINEVELLFYMCIPIIIAVLFILIVDICNLHLEIISTGILVIVIIYALLISLYDVCKEF